MSDFWLLSFHEGDRHEQKTFNDIHEITTRLDELRGVMSEAKWMQTNLLKQKSAVLEALTNKAGDTDGLLNLDALKTIKLNKDIFGNYVSAVKSVLLHEKQVSAFCVEQLEKIEEQCTIRVFVFVSKNSLRSPRRTIYVW